MEREFVESLQAYYELLAEDAERDDNSVGQQLGLSIEQSIVVRNSLIRLGLLIESPIASSGWSVLSPEAAACRLVQDHKNKVQFLTAEIETMEEDLSTLVNEFTVHGRRKEIEKVVGMTRIMAALNDAARLTQREMATIHPGLSPSPEVTQANLARHQDVLARGAAVRAVYQTATLRHSHTRSDLGNQAALGVQVRTAQLLPLRLVLVDELVAVMFVPASPTALVVRNGPLIAVLRDVFEHVWTTSDPPPTSTHQIADDALARPIGQQLEILRLLAAGMTDEAIARKIGVSTRTIRRQTSEIMDQLDAGSRFQAGILASRLGWVD